ncbi:MAG: SMP-30/gluconolactonase/LRE family protein, partial [Thermomicrobiales bacterium]
MPIPKLVADTLCKTGEGPLWHETEQKLYWVDIPAGTIYRYDPETESYDEHNLGGIIGGFTFQSDGGVLLFQERGMIRLWKDSEVTTVIEDIADERDGGRFNDVIADPDGRVYCGTVPIGDRPGKLYRLDLDKSLTVVIEDAGLSNGMGFTPDLEWMYHSDSSDNR